MWRRLGGAVLVFCATQCASTSPPSGQRVPVISDPPGAMASGAGQRITTPGSLLVPDGAREMEIRIEKAGFETAFVLLTAESGSMRDCINRTTLSPGKSSGGSSETGDPGVVIGIAVSKALAECSSETAGRLEPSMVFVKLVPVAETSPPR